MGKRNWNYTPEFRAKVVAEFRTYEPTDERDYSASGVAQRYGITRGMVYQWARQALVKAKPKVPEKPLGLNGFPHEDQSMQITSFMLRSREEGRLLVDLLQSAGKQPSAYDPLNGRYFVNVYTYAHYTDVARWVREKLPDVGFQVKGPELPA